MGEEEKKALSGPSAVLSAVLSSPLFSYRLIPKQLHSDDCEREGSEFDLTAKSHVRRRRRPCNFQMFFSPSIPPTVDRGRGAAPHLNFIIPVAAAEKGLIRKTGTGVE